MKQFIRDPRVHVFILLLPFVWAYAVADAQPVPKQEQNTRLIHALEQHNRVMEENTRATRELTQALRSAKMGM